MLLFESLDLLPLPFTNAHTCAGCCRNTADPAWIGAGLTVVRAGLTKSVGTEERRMKHFEGLKQVCLQDMLERRKGADTDEHGMTRGRMIDAVGNGGGADSSEENWANAQLETADFDASAI